MPACGGSDGPPAASTAPAGTSATLAVLETTDLHTNVLSYDDFKPPTARSASSATMTRSNSRGSKPRTR
ncbi:hypothetical protein BH759_02820 [Ralstonia solanacearum]|nr:hypothetical protein BH759_02820 [Ralstonia solanacearum]CCF97532.1 hypothetical protein RSK60_220002 [Ralstonia solanacearum K60]